MSKVLFSCAEVSGLTKVYLFYCVVVFRWRCGPDQFLFGFGGPLMLFNRKHECLFCCLLNVAQWISDFIFHGIPFTVFQHQAICL